jgi:hypothetical protein
MKSTVKCITGLALLSMTFLTGLKTQAQTLASNTDWIAKQLNKLVTDDEEHSMNLNGKKAQPKFSFKGCQMNMLLDSKDKEVSIGMDIAWQLKEVRHISYQRGKKGQYQLVLDVPTDKVKMNMGLGGFAGSFNTDEKDTKNTDDTSSFTLDTKDEALVGQIKQKLEESVQLCRKQRK